jgi:hypothetical protein
VLKERIINGALADVFKRAPLAAAPRRHVSEAANDEPQPVPDVAADADIDTPQA